MLDACICTSVSGLASRHKSLNTVHDHAVMYRCWLVTHLAPHGQSIGHPPHMQGPLLYMLRPQHESVSSYQIVTDSSLGFGAWLSACTCMHACMHLAMTWAKQTKIRHFLPSNALQVSAAAMCCPQKALCMQRPTETAARI